MKACATGTHIKEATITHRKAGKTQHEYLIVKMNDIIITGVAPSGVAGQPDTGSEMVTLTFAKVDLEYRPQNPNGIARRRRLFQVRPDQRTRRSDRFLATRTVAMDPSVETRELTIDEAVAVAILLQRNEQLDEAQAVYQRVLESVPDHPDALHYAGVLAHQQGRSDEAVALIEKSLAIAPDRADCYSNLGIIYKSMGRLEAAVGACRAGDCHRPRPRQRSQQPRRAAEGHGPPRRSGGRLSRRDSPRPAAHRRLHQPGHPAERAEANGGGRRVLQPGHHAQAEAQGSAQAAGAGALHPRRDR